MSTSTKILKSSTLLLLIKFVQRGIGLFSTLLLARLLTPADFGVVAISLTIIYFIEAMSTLGTEQYIIQKSQINDEILNTAWTVDLLVKSALLFIFLLAVPYIAGFYNMPKLQPVLYVSSVIIILNAAVNPGLFVLKKEFNYKPIFWVSIAQKAFSFAVVIFIAVIQPSYWAMVFGDIVSSVVLLIGSYVIHPFRPVFSLTGFADQWLFSKWIILRGIIGYTRSQFDTFIVSTVFSVRQLGGYNMVRQLSIMPSTEIIAPAVEPLLSAFSLSKNQVEQLGYQFRVSFLIVSIVTLPIAGYLWVFPEPIIDTLLGSKWSWTYHYLSAFSIFFISIALVQVLATLCVAAGKLRGLLIYESSGLVIIVTVLWLIKGFDMYHFIIVRGALGMLTVTGLLLYMNTQINVGILRLVNMLIPILTAVVISSWVVRSYFDFTLAPVFRLLSTGVLFVLFFSMLIFLFYRVFFYKYPEWHKVYVLVTAQIGGLAAKFNG